jgi:3-hydroxyacyl-CoA dehydrogenase
VHTPEGSWSPARRSYVGRSNLPVYQRQVFRAPVVGAGGADGKTAGTTLHEDESVRLWHQDDEVLILSLKTKMHVISPGVIDGLARAITEAENNFKGLVIWNADAAEGGAFSAGADLQRCCRCSCPAASKPSSRK